MVQHLSSVRLFRHVFKAKNADSYEGEFVETTAITVGGLPGIITNESFAVGDEQVTLSWIAPTDGANTGYYPITSYTIERYNAQTTTWDPETTTPNTSATISGLINGDSYLFRVSVNTVIGTGSTVEIGPAIPEALPGKPVITTVTPSDESLVVVWTPPADTGGKTITDYDIQYQVTGGNGWIQYDENNVSTQTTETISGLVNQTSYSVQVRALTEVGPGQWSDIETATPVGPPESPTGIEFVVDSQSGELTSLNWVASMPNSPDSITYQVQYRTSSDGSWIDINDSNGSDQTIGLSELAISTSDGYEFQLQASTGLGASDAVIVEPFENLVITSSDAKISLDWDDLQNAVSDYTVQYRIAGNSLWTFVPFEPVSNTSEAQIQQLVNGTAYDIRITSVPATTAQPVSIVIETVMPAGLPQMTSAPRWTNLSVASGSAAIEWNAASSNGADVTDYIIEYTTDNVIFTQIGDEGVSTQTSATLTGLPTSVPLAVRVTAVNRIGTGSPSPLSTTQTLPGAPSTPSSLAASPNDTGGIALTWTAPSTSGGLPLLGYFIEYKAGSADTWLSWLPDGGDISTTSTSATVTGTELVRNVNDPYVFRVTAKNSGHNSVPSTLSNQVVPYAAPDAITLNATPGDRSMQLSWEVPVDHDNGGIEVTGYQVEGRITGSDAWSVITNANATSRSIPVSSLNGTRLENSVSHDFRVAAVNGVTPLKYQSVTRSPMGTAAAPTNLQASSGSSSVTLSWEAPTDNGGGVITDYEIEYRVQNEDNPGEWIDASDIALSLSETSSRVPALTPGTRYEFQVAAVNGAGTGAFSSIESVVVGPTPAAPPAVFAWKQSGQIHLLWDSVSMPAGVSLEYYQVQYRRVGTDSWATLGTDEDIRATFPGLPSGTYQFRVAAKANTGIGAYRISNQTVSF